MITRRRSYDEEIKLHKITPSLARLQVLYTFLPWIDNLWHHQNVEGCLHKCYGPLGRYTIIIHPHTSNLQNLDIDLSKLKKRNTIWCIILYSSSCQSSSFDVSELCPMASIQFQYTSDYVLYPRRKYSGMEFMPWIVKQIIIALG